MNKKNAMYIKRLFLKNVRCFEKLEINFDRAGSSALILGDNGDGKSTVLRSIAMGLCDESSAAALFRELPGEFVRRRKGSDEAKTGDEAIIEVDFTSGGGIIYQIVTTITSLDAFEKVSQERYMIRPKIRKKKLKKEEKFPWKRIFISGYGPGLRTQGSADIQHYLAVDAIYPLFKYDARLQNPELVIRRIITEIRKLVKDPRTKQKYENEMLNKIKQLLVDLLDLEKTDQIHLTSTGIKIESHWGKAELGELGDGYQATITWVLDFISWWFTDIIYKGKIDILKTVDFKKDIRGIVLIDEIEQHLHPKWQRSILYKLKENFPEVQFIATTHSPLVASSTSKTKVHILRAGQHEIKVPFGWLAEDVYSLMGLPQTRADVFSQEILDEFELLDQKKIKGIATKEELRKLKKIKKQLGLLPESDPIRLTTEIENIIKWLEEGSGEK